MRPLPGATVGQFRRARAGRYRSSPLQIRIRSGLVTRRSNFAPSELSAIWSLQRTHNIGAPASPVLLAPLGSAGVICGR